MMSCSSDDDGYFAIFRQVVKERKRRIRIGIEMNRIAGVVESFLYKTEGTNSKVRRERERVSE